MGASADTTSEQFQPFLPPTLPPEAVAAYTYGFPAPVHPLYEDHSPAYLLLPVYPHHRRLRRRGCCVLPALSASSIISSVFFTLLFASAIFLLWPSDPELSVVRLRLDRFKVAPLPAASIDIAMGLEIEIHNPSFFAIDYNSIVASIFYRGERLCSVTSAGGRVAARGVSYVDADLHLDGIRVLELMIYLIGDLAKGSVPFDTVTEIRGWLRFFFFDVPIKGKTSCMVHVNPNDQTITHQDCYLA
ncbi:hypothetical protein KSP40_PGU019343 [Platanthera guangdongensis]|uniref:Late embryogenesis abundant protein LEA-2 subgroup domain-containing protein n=1 Tax=Platanthera guangdongensis TaxID=2320717 RepID=A0ABR2MJV2_9ASPA